MHSIRTRLLTGTILGIVLLLTIFSLMVYIMIRSTLIKQFDTSLASIAQILAASVELDGNEIELEFEVKQMSEFQNAEHPTYYQLWTSDGEALARSPLLKTDDLIRPEGSLNKLFFMPPLEKNGKTLRSVGLTFVPRDADNDEIDVPLPPTNNKLLTLTVARDSGNLMNQLLFLRRLLLIASLTVILLSLLIAAIIVRKGLNPLNTIAAEIATMSENNLAKRITTEHVPEEIIPIKNRLNELMSRLETSFNRERQFNADVAHELRTPLAGIRSTIEVTLTRNRQATEYRQALSDCLEITKTMQRMVSNLLVLSGLDAKQKSFQSETVTIAEIVDSCWKSFSGKALPKDITFDNRIDSDIMIETDRQICSIVISNILENAIVYADKGGQIWTSASRNNGIVDISISNTGCELTFEQISHVFDSFWRGDSSRSDVGVHFGLGLALVHKLTEALGGHATAELRSEGIFTLCLNIPLKPQTQAH